MASSVDLDVELRSLLMSCDMSKETSKTIRRQLEQKLGMDLEPRKEEIKEKIKAIVQEMVLSSLSEDVHACCLTLNVPIPLWIIAAREGGGRNRAGTLPSHHLPPAGYPAWPSPLSPSLSARPRDAHPCSSGPFPRKRMGTRTRTRTRMKTRSQRPRSRGASPPQRCRSTCPRSS